MFCFFADVRVRCSYRYQLVLALDFEAQILCIEARPSSEDTETVVYITDLGGVAMACRKALCLAKRKPEKYLPRLVMRICVLHSGCYDGPAPLPRGL